MDFSVIRTMARWRGHLSPKLERVIQPDPDELSPGKGEHHPPPTALVLDPHAHERGKESRKFNEPCPIQSGGSRSRQVTPL